MAYVVTAAAGMDSSGYTFAYIGQWAAGEVSTVRQAAETVTTAARAILRHLDSAPEQTDDTAETDAQAALPAAA